MRRIGVSVTILPDTQEQVARAAEVLARTITGLAFEGMGVSMNIHEYDDEETE